MGYWSLWVPTSKAGAAKFFALITTTDMISHALRLGRAVLAGRNLKRVISSKQLALNSIRQ